MVSGIDRGVLGGSLLVTIAGALGALVALVGSVAMSVVSIMKWVYLYRTGGNIPRQGQIRMGTGELSFGKQGGKKNFRLFIILGYISRRPVQI